MLFFKMGNAFLEEVTGMGRELTSEAAVGIVDGSGQLCLSSVPEEVSLGEERQKEIGDRIDETLEAGMSWKESGSGAAPCLHTVRKTAGWWSFPMSRTVC